MIKPEKLAIVPLIIVLALSSLWLPLQVPKVRAVTTPTVSGGVVNNFQSSLTLISGSPLYLYGLVTGGGFPSSAFVNGPYAPVNDAAGFLIAELAVTSSSTNSYTTQTSFPAIGGIAVSGFSTYTKSFGSNNAPAAPSASDTFTVSDTGSLVVVVALAGGEQSLEVSGVAGLATDATNFNGSCNQSIPPVILFGHAYPSPGQYTVTEQTTQCAAGQDPNHAGDLIGVFVFSPGPPGGSSSTWTDITPTPPAPSPPTRWGAGFAYDQKDQYSLLFAGDGGGGCASDTWTYANGIWTQLSPSNSPSTRCADTSMAYDPVDGYVLLFGGTFNGVTFGDTWSFVGGVWTNLTPSLSVSPPARWAASLAYDPVDNYMLLFGGVDSSNRNLNDAWAFKGGAWTQIATANAPSPRSFAGLVYDPTDNEMITFGGAADTWKFVASAWTQLSPATSPPSRWAPGLVWDSADGFVVMFGGWHDVSTTLADTWKFVGNSWTQLSPSKSPTARGGPNMIFDAADSYALLFGGQPSGCCTLSDTWKFGAVSLPVTVSLTVAASIGGSITVQSTAINGGSATNVASGQSQTFVIPEGSLVSLNALPRAGYDFIQWSLTGESTIFGLKSMLITIVVGNSGSASASFVPSFQYSLTAISMTSGTDGLNCGALCVNDPPDVQTAAGSGHIVEMVNQQMRITSETDIKGSSDDTGLSTVFQSGSDLLGDPQVVYDSSSQRWFASILDRNKDTVILATSMSSDPTTLKNAIVVTLSPPATSCLPDHPNLGFSDDKVAITASNYPCAGGLSGSIFWIINKSDLISGSSSPVLQVFTDTSAFFARPVRSLSSSSVQYFISNEDLSLCPIICATQLHLISAAGNPPNIPSLTSTVIHIKPISDNGERGAQPGTSPVTIDAVPYRIQDAIWQQSNLWTALDDACTPAGDTQVHTCFRVIEINTSSSSVNQDFDAGAVGKDYFFPALSMDSSSNLGIVFGYSSKDDYPSLAITGRGSNDPSSTLAKPLTVAKGTTTYQGTSDCSEFGVIVSLGKCRYGDYFGAAFDPSYPDSLWVAGEYENGGLSCLFCAWDTFIAQMKIAPPLIQSLSSQPVFNGLASIDNTSTTGVAIALTIPLVPDGTIATFLTGTYSSQLLTTGPLAIGPLGFYDARIIGISSGTARVCVTNQAVSAETIMQFWNNTVWTGLSNMRTSLAMICGDVPVVSLTGTPMVIGNPPQISISESFTDGSGMPLTLASSGNPRVDVILSNGKVRSTNPGQVLAFTNLTNTGNVALQSVSLNDTVPTDWTVHPSWLPAIGGITAFFEFSNGTRLDITNKTMITVSTGNPELISLSISNMTATMAGKPLGPGESILLAAKLSYGLIGTSQSFTSYPRNYTDTSSASAWTQASFSGGQALASGSASFTAHAKVNGDVNGDGVVNLQDASMMVYAFGARPGDARWNPALDVLGEGVIDLQDVSYVFLNYGNHA